LTNAVKPSDQECIDQDDPTDVERHLGIMHHVYRQSWTTIAMLGQVTPAYDKSLLSDFAQFFDGDKYARLDRVLGATEFAKHIISDRWFTRSWTFHEKYCTRSLYFLIPLHADHGLHPSSFHRLIDDDLSVEISELQSSRFPVEFRRTYSGGGHKIAQVPQTEDLFANEPPDVWSQDWSQFRSVLAILTQLESCNKEITSDRLAILSNICGLSVQLQTRLLNSSAYSYSTSALVLGMAGICPDRHLRKQVCGVFVHYIMDRNISHALDLGFTDFESLAHALDRLVTHARNMRLLF
jgi:hypothetical protein